LDRLAVQPLVVEDDAQVVLRARILCVDATAEAAQQLEVARGTRGQCGRCSGGKRGLAIFPGKRRRNDPRAGRGGFHATCSARRIAWSDAPSGWSRKCARRSSPPSSTRFVFTQNT